MKKFQFSLETLLKVCRKRENTAQETLLVAQLALQSKRKDLFYLELQKKKVNKEIQQSQKMFYSIDQKITHLNYLKALEKRILDQQGKVARAARETEDKRHLVVLAMQKRKTIENLEEKCYNEWKYETNEKEKAFFDDIATIRFTRNEK